MNTDVSDWQAEFRASALAAPRVTAQTAPPALSLLRQPTASTSGMLRGTGRGASPMASYTTTMQQQQRYVADKFKNNYESFSTVLAIGAFVELATD